MAPLLVYAEPQRAGVMPPEFTQKGFTSDTAASLHASSAFYTLRLVFFITFAPSSTVQQQSDRGKIIVQYVLRFPFPKYLHSDTILLNAK